jgi:glucokinase
MAVTCAIGVDVGGTKIAAGAVSLPDCRVLASRWQLTDASRGGRAVLDDVVEQANSLEAELRDQDLLLSAVGVGVAELVGGDGRVLSAATIDWLDIDVAGELARRLGVPTMIDADVRAAARGEAHFGAGRGYDSFLYVSVGTGISASLVIAGIPYAGARGLTGTFASARGLMPIDDGGLAAGPPLEQFASGPALTSRYESAGGGRCSPPNVLARAAASDEAAISVVVSAGDALGAAIAQLVNMLDPQAVVLGGGLGLAEGLYRDSLAASLRRSVWSPLHADVPLKSGQLAADAGIIGAAMAAASLKPSG